jgi:vacuolar-type H+-ATPase subunit I/STV1
MPNTRSTIKNNLITAKEASVMAGKSVATIRSWVRKGKLTPYKEDVNNHSSPLLISAEELKTYLHTGATITHPNNNGRPVLPSASIQEKEHKIQALQNELMILKSQEESSNERVADLQSFITTLKELMKQRDREIEGLTQQLNQSLHREESNKEELKELLKWASLPFWKRWNSDLRRLNG